jgi:hypothetical protein
VIYDAESDRVIRSIHVAGALRFDPGRDTRLVVGLIKIQALPRCFLFIGGELTRMPTQPWAKAARYTPGQVWCPAHVDRADVNPRPLSPLVPSNGLIGCFSGDGSWVLATAWEPYQELFQGAFVCLHSDFRIAGLDPGETARIRGKLCITGPDVAALVERYEADSPEHRAQARKGGTA